MNGHVPGVIAEGFRSTEIVVDRQRQIHQRTGRRRMIARRIQRAARAAAAYQWPQMQDRRVVEDRRRVVKEKLAAQGPTIDAAHRADQNETTNNAVERRVCGASHRGWCAAHAECPKSDARWKRNRWLANHTI